MVAAKRVYHPYWEWECYRNGMWGKLEKNPSRLESAVQFTGNHLAYGSAMMRVVEEWPVTMENFLTNPSVNHLAHIGHCACSFAHKFEESLVRQAWSVIDNRQRQLANLAAMAAKKKWIGIYAEKNKRVRSIVGQQVLF